MTVAPVEIANRALAKISNASIAALTEASEGARVCARHYPVARDLVLSANDWRFARRVQALALEVNDRPSDWTYRYQRPDCLRFWRVVPATGRVEPNYTVPHEPLGASIYSNDANARGVFTVRVEDMTLAPAAVVEAIVWRLAFEIAPQLTQVSGDRNYAYAGYMQSLADAIAQDAQEGQADTWASRDELAPVAFHIAARGG